MKLTVDDQSNIQLEEVFNNITLKTKDGETMSICMRDSGFEFKYQDKWYEAKKSQLKQFKEEVQDFRPYVECHNLLSNKDYQAIENQNRVKAIIGDLLLKERKCLEERAQSFITAYGRAALDVIRRVRSGELYSPNNEKMFDKVIEILNENK